MLQKTVNERFSRECTQFELAGIRCPVAKGNLVVFELDQAAVGDGYPENIGGEVFQGCVSIADWFAVHHPILLPDLRRYLCEKGRFL